MPSNEERADKAAKALRVYAREMMTNPSAARQELEVDPKTVIGDLICDIRHYCDMRGISFDEALLSGQTHYHAETNEEAQV